MKFRKPRYHRVVLIVKDEPAVGEPYLTDRELRVDLAGFVRAATTIGVESVEKVKMCKRCNKPIPPNSMISPGWYCDPCFRLASNSLGHSDGVEP